MRLRGGALLADEPLLRVAGLRGAFVPLLDCAHQCVLEVRERVRQGGLVGARRLQLLAANERGGVRGAQRREHLGLIAQLREPALQLLERASRHGRLAPQLVFKAAHAVEALLHRRARLVALLLDVEQLGSGAGDDFVRVAAGFQRRRVIATRLRERGAAWSARAAA